MIHITIGPLPMGTIPSTPRPTARSLAYFCPRCGLIWSRLTRDSAKTWEIQYRACHTCHDAGLYWMVAPEYQGCISSYPGGDQDLQPSRDWPHDLLKYELLTTMDNLERTAP